MGVILSIDKLEKIGREGVEKELKEKKISSEVVEKLMDYVSVSGSNSDKVSRLKSLIGGSVEEVEKVLEFAGFENVEFDPSLARGLAYYTGTVFEVFLKNSEIASSVAGGGRYDGMIGGFVKNRRDYPAVGISFGLDVITDALKLSEARVSGKSVAKAFVVSIGEDKASLDVASGLRKKGVNVDVDFTGKVGKAIEYADSYGIPFVVFVGSRELAGGNVKVRDMKTGVEKLIKTESLSSEDFKEKKVL